MNDERLKRIEADIELLKRLYNDMQTTPNFTPEFLKSIQGILNKFSITDFGDVEITSLADNQILKYNSGNQKWENATDEIGAM